MNKSDKSIDITRIKSHVINLKSNTKKLEKVQKSLNAINFGGQLMIINTLSANTLIDKYFKNE